MQSRDGGRHAAHAAGKVGDDTSVAGLGPALVTVIVEVTTLPATTVAGELTLSTGGRPTG